VSGAGPRTLSLLWRLSRDEAETLRARIALVERAVMRAIGGEPVPGGEAAWAEVLADAERAAEAARERTARLAALLGRGAA